MSVEQVDIVVREQGADKARQSIAGVGDAADKSAHQVQGLTEASNLLRDAMVALGLTMTVEKLIELSDAYTNMQNQLKLVSRNTAELLHTQEELLHIANETRQSMGGTVDLYSALGIATKNLNVSHKDLLGMVTTVNQALTISGKSSDEVGQAMRRFALSMSQGTVDSRGMTTVLLQFPALARAIADGLNIDVGALRTMAAQGQLTAADMTRALGNSASSVQKTFAEMTPTIGQAFQVLRNNLDETIGKMLTTRGTGALLANVIVLIANNVEPLIKGLSILAAGIAAYTVATVAARLATISFTAALAANPFTTIFVLLTTLASALYQYAPAWEFLRDTALAALQAIVDMLQKVAEYLGGFFEYFKKMGEELKASSSKIGEYIKSVGQASEDMNKKFNSNVLDAANTTTTLTKAAWQTNQGVQTAYQPLGDYIYKPVKEGVDDSVKALKELNDEMSGAAYVARNSMSSVSDSIKSARETMSTGGESESSGSSGGGSSKGGGGGFTFMIAPDIGASQQLFQSRGLSPSESYAMALLSMASYYYGSMQQAVGRAWLTSAEGQGATPELAKKAGQDFWGIRGVDGFAMGGGFDVAGAGGPDSQLVQFMATPGERVTVQTPGQQRSSGQEGGNIIVHMTVNGVTNPADFRRSQTQIVTQFRSALQRVNNRIGTS